MTRPPLLAACALALALTGCGDDEANDADTTSAADTAGEAGETTAAGVQTRGDGCELTGRAGCMRALTCNLTFTDLELCTSNAVDVCCADAGSCDEAVSNDPWQACADALETQDCEEVGTLPAACEPLALGT